MENYLFLKRILKMKYIAFSILFCIINTGCKPQKLSNNVYDINITIKPYQNKCIYLGYYYGNKRGILDSLCLDDNGKGYFKGEKSLPSGVYFIVTPQKTVLFEFLIDKDQYFDIQADTAGVNKNIQFTNSPDNQLFQQYSNTIYILVQKIKEGEKNLITAKNNSEKTILQKQIDAYNQQIENYRANIIKKYPVSLLSLIFRTMREPSKPILNKTSTKLDSFYYYKKHYWDDIQFYDGRLVHTPIFESKLDRYFGQLVSPAADSINREMDWMLLYAQNDSTMYRFLVSKFIDEYINPKIMGQDAVFVHLFEKQIATGKVNWLNEEQKKYIFNRAYSVMTNLIGQQGADIHLADTTDRIVSLYNVKGPYTLVCFWDPNCGHCQHLMPKLDSIYEAKWKNRGLKIFAVMIESNKETWIKYIQDNHLQDWINVYYTDALRNKESISKKPSYRQLYDAFFTPTLILLDENKRIIAKNLTYLQLDDFMNFRMRNKK